MIDLTKAIEAKSDQLNAVDLLPGPRTIKITAVKPLADNKIAVSFEGDNNKHWKPCKSMIRAMVTAWGLDASKYVGKRVTIIRDPSVVFKGEKVGGIVITHMSGIKQRTTMSLAVSRGVTKLFNFDTLPEDSCDKIVPVSKGQEREPTHQDLVQWLGGQCDNAVKYLTTIGRIKEGQTLSDLTPAQIAKLFQNQAFLDSAGITLTQTQQT